MFNFQSIFLVSVPGLWRTWLRAFSSVVVLSSSYLCQIQNLSLTQPSIHGWVNAHVNCGLSKGLNKGWGGMWQAVPRALWPRTIPSNMLPPEWTFNFSNYQSNAFCHSRPICFDFCRINLGTIVRRWVTKVEERWHHRAERWQTWKKYWKPKPNVGKKISSKSGITRRADLEKLFSPSRLVKVFRPVKTIFTENQILTTKNCNKDICAGYPGRVSSCVLGVQQCTRKEQQYNILKSLYVWTLKRIFLAQIYKIPLFYISIRSFCSCCFTCLPSGRQICDRGRWGEGARV